MFFQNFNWRIIILLNLLGYFIFRFGMVSRGALKEIVEFIGGLILSASFILMFLFFGAKEGFILILIFLFVITPIVEIFIAKIQKKINEPYK